MAFNFNWSPLIADTSRARDMLTSALNKSPKPPIIVDDIIVTELNLGSTPPELEILEIGDLAEDRFRGIFKLAYSGDAFLTLKTRVQANPLNTHLSTKPSFASPQPLAAGSGLTIPLQITLSDFRMSGFVILVFSKQKGITLVFRNDPLESLKVSSTFDSIPFVRDYLQKVIEEQLRVLFMEDLPAIVHRLSLRLFSSEYSDMETEEVDGQRNDDSTIPVDPLASPPQDPTDAFGFPLDDDQFSLDPSAELHASFSQKNLLRLAALTDSHRTLSLFTPSIRDTVFRAWAGPSDRADQFGQHPSFAAASLSRMNSALGIHSDVSTVSGSGESDASSSRPTLSSFSSYYGSNGGRNRARPKKRRVVDLRRPKDESKVPDAAPLPDAVQPPARVPATIQEREVDLPSPTTTPTTYPRLTGQQPSQTTSSAISSINLTSSTAESPSSSKSSAESAPPPYHLHESLPTRVGKEKPNDLTRHNLNSIPMFRNYSFEKPGSPLSAHGRTSSFTNLYCHHHPQQYWASGHAGTSYFESTGSILEQAWMRKMATEIASRVAGEKAAREKLGGVVKGIVSSPGAAPPLADAPPAYGS
ncbi:hypothetical protein P152DRAFT_113555 [Eremomyces bilateralis CBS 781.70]|uniref:Mitochondrial distribution and morphology protein 34 n=1 Tax=Eremomyces bilateralis CBS 781.70 TaxID=1392243 RepID=A0A6G1GE97_9PEZI|nr:uncharacterized protein P152DRAFT_113555 [Eremomyces bilateralis CBS 781.70]KAF1816189.1 hypothetical protein P152DRAFT_113555 [Eremomyces bilateralis CBS 781.70]